MQVPVKVQIDTDGPWTNAVLTDERAHPAWEGDEGHPSYGCPVLVVKGEEVPHTWHDFEWVATLETTDLTDPEVQAFLRRCIRAGYRFLHTCFSSAEWCLLVGERRR